MTPRRSPPKKKPAPKRSRAAAKAVIEAVNEIGAKRLLRGTMGDMTGSSMAVHAAINEKILAFVNNPDLTSRQLMQAVKAHTAMSYAAAAMAEKFSAVPPADGQPLPQPGDNAKIIEGTALPQQPPGMIEQFQKLAEARLKRGGERS